MVNTRRITSVSLKQEINLSFESFFLCIQREVRFYHQRWRFQGKKPPETRLVTFLIDSPKPKLCLDSSIIGYQNLSLLSCQFLTNLLCLCLKTVKTACFGHFLGPSLFFEKVKVCFFFSCSFLPCKYITRPATRTQEGWGKIPLPNRRETLFS